LPRQRRPDYVGNLIAGLQAEGLSANQGLQRLKEAGYGMRRQNFLQLWGSVQAAGAVREKLQAEPVFHVPQQAEIPRVPSPRARGYRYDVDVLGRDSTSGALMYMPTAIITPTLITHLEAIEKATQELQLAIAGGRPGVDYATVVGGGVVLNVTERVLEIDEPIE
jgi:hypothetical protein